MARLARTDSVKTTHKLRAWRNARGLTLEQLAEMIGMSHQNLGKIERGLVPLGEEHHGPLTRALGIEVADLFRDPSEPRRAASVPIVGRVGADNEGRVLFATGQAAGDRAPVPPGGTERASALEVAGHSMRGVADDGALIYFEEQHTTPSRDHIGRVVVTELETGEVLVKRLLRGDEPGTWDLESIVGPTLQNVRIKWVANISAIIPPPVSQRVIIRAHAA